MASRRRSLDCSAREVFRSAARGALAAALLASALSSAAADAPAAAAGADASSLTSEQIKPGLFRINGAGGGTLLLVGTNELIVVDSKRAGGFSPLVTEIRRIAEMAALPGSGRSALVLTATGPEQAGNVAQFADAGVSLVVQQRAVPLLGDAARAGGSTQPGTRLITYGTDYMLRVGKLEAEVEHVGSGRTGVDSVVLFRDLRTLAVGELYTSGTPVADCASGGSFAGWAAAIAHAMWLPFDVAVPSRGAPVGKPELLALKDRLVALAAGPSECRRPT